MSIDDQDSLDEGEVGSAFTDAMASAGTDAIPTTPPSEPTPPAPAVPASSVQPEPDYSALYDQARSIGMNVDGNLTPQQIAEAAIQELQRQRPYADYARQIAPYANEIQSYLAQQQQAQQAPQAQPQQADEWNPAKYLQEKWGAPGWSSEWDLAIQRGVVQQDPDTGLYQPSPGYEVATSSIVAQMNQARAAQLSQWQQLGRQNPLEYFYSALQEPLRRQWQEDVRREVQQMFSQQKVANAIDTFEAQNSGWLYKTDPFGNRSWSDEGNLLFQELQSLQQAGVQDPQTRLNIALRSTGLATRVAGAQAAPPVQQAAPAQQAANPAASQGGQSFLGSALTRASHAPNAQAPGVQVPPEGSVMVTDGELSNMFVNDFRRARS